MTDEQKAKVKQAHDVCVKETSVSTELIIKGRNGDFVDDDKLKNFIFCFFKKIGFQNEAGEFQLNVIRAKLSSDYKPEEVNKLIETCSGVKGKNPADKAFEAYKCYYKTASKHVSFI